jgi:hypothetical protein
MQMTSPSTIIGTVAAYAALGSAAAVVVMFPLGLVIGMKKDFKKETKK